MSLTRFSGGPAALWSALPAGQQMSQGIDAFDGAVDKLERENGRRQNDVANTDCFKDIQRSLLDALNRLHHVFIGRQGKPL
jgi:hypothetical protein